MAERLRIFISSPGDVDAERLRAHLVIGRLARDYARFFSIEACLWEHEPMLASGHFQDAIEPPGAFDIVVVILYARLGTPLPEKTALRSYQGLDGRVPVTGTEWEFEDALNAHRARGAPDLLAYRKSGDPGTSLANRELRQEQEKQWQMLEGFWARHFENGGIFLAGSARFSTLEDFDARLERDLTALIERRIKRGDAIESGALWLKGSPFRGLETYEFADADIFFGRDGETRTALARLRDGAAAGTAFLVVLGASGAGKSSLARAGLLPGLVAPGAVTAVGLWRRVILRPGHGGEDPVVALASALVAGQSAAGEGLPELLGPQTGVAALAQHLVAAADDPSFPFRLALNQVAEQARAKGLMLAHEQAKLVILADQFEELFSPGIAPERRALFVRVLAGLARSGLVQVIATIRNDFWHRAAELPEFIGLVESGARFDLARPDGAAMIEIVRRPAAVAGLDYEVDPQTGLRLDAVIAAAASQEIGALPLLSVMLDTLYQRDVQAAGGTRLLTFAGYRAMGELRGAIAQRAESVLARLKERDPEAAGAFPTLLRQMIGITEGVTVARPLPMSGVETGSPQARLIDCFLQPDARLLVVNASSSGPELRLAHEALISNWPRAETQIAQDQNDHVLRGRLEAQMAGWREAKSADKGRALLTGLSLAEGLDLARRWGRSLDPALAAFIQTSHRAASRRRRQIVGASLAAMVIFAMIAAVALLQRREAVAAAEVARRETAASLAAQSSGLVEHSDVEGALRLAIKAAGVDPDIASPHAFPVSEPALLGALAIDRQVLHLDMPHHVYPLMPVRFLDDATLVWVTPDAVLMVVGLHPSPHVIRRIPLPGMVRPRQIAVADGHIAVIGAKDRVTMVDCATGKIKATIMTGNWVNDVDIDAASGAVAIALPDKVLLTHLADTAPPRRLHLPTTAAPCDRSQVRFSSDGTLLYVACGTNVYAMNVATGSSGPEPVAQLDMSVAGVTPQQLGKLLHSTLGGAHFERIVPDQTGGKGLLTVFTSELRAFVPGSQKPVVIASHGPYFLGLGAAGAMGATRKSMVAIRGERGATLETFTLQYLPMDSKKLLPPIETFSVPVRLFANAILDHCQISPQGSYLLCQYFGGGREGFYVWLIGGGAHREERLVNQYGDAALPMPGTAALAMVNGFDGLKLRERSGAEIRLGALPPGLKPTRVTTSYLAAVDDVGQRVMVAQFGPTAESLRPVMQLMPGVDARFGPTRHKVIVTGRRSVSAFSLPNGKLLWKTAMATAPWNSALSADGHSFALARAGTVTLYDTANGKPSGKISIPGNLPGLTLMDHFATRLAYADKASSVRIVSLPDGKAIAMAKSSIPVARLLWRRDGSMLLVGHRDGSISAFDSAGHKLWRVPSPLNGAFSEQQGMPGRPPRGVVLRLAFSPKGRRFAVVREQMAELDLYDAASGTLLTHLSSPWSFGEPATVHLGKDGLIASSWATFPNLLDKPRRIMLHQIPERFSDILALARVRLQTLQTSWSAKGPRAAITNAQKPAKP